MMCVDVRAPAGTFFLDPLASEPMVLIGAGIGVTPLVSMLEAIVQTGRPREVQALFGFRSGADHPFKGRLASLAEENPNLRLHVSYSAPRKSDVLYRDYNHRGRITIERVRQVLPSNNYRFYVCGPGRFDGIARAGAVGMGRARVARSLRGVWAGEREERRGRSDRESNATCGLNGAIARRCGTVRLRRYSSSARRRA